MSLHLIEILENEDPSLKANLDTIKNKAADHLLRIPEFFGDYTPHDIHHKERVVGYLDMIIPDQIKKVLNKYEIYFLLAATYIHDIGMIKFSESEEKSLLNLHVPEEDISDWLREHHHERSEAYLIEYHRDFHIDYKAEAKIIGRIARGHRKENLSDPKLFNNNRNFSTVFINEQLLAAFLRIADELDLSFERTPMIIYEHVYPKNPISQEHWDRHNNIEGIGIDDIDNPLVIQGNATCQSHKVYRSIKNLENKINHELDLLPNYLHRYRKNMIYLPKKFQIEITAENFIPIDLKFSLKEKEIVSLLLGEKLYTSPYECIRELIKNARDACKLKQDFEDDKLLNPPKINLELSQNCKKLIISDEGYGMNEQTIRLYFTQIGKSFFSKDSFSSDSHGFTPVSELGIGILSCFMLAKEIKIETKTEDESWLITIDDVSDYFIVRSGTKDKVGTSVTLDLMKPLSETDFIKISRKYVRHLDVPVILNNTSKGTIELEMVQSITNNPEFTAIFGSKYLKLAICENVVEGEIGCIGPLFSTSSKDSKSKLNLPNDFELSIISNEGIFVCNGEYYPSWLNSNFLFYDLNLRQRCVELNTARNDIIENESLGKIKLIIQNQFIELSKKCINYIQITYRDHHDQKIVKLREFFSEYIIGPFSHYQGKISLPLEIIKLFKDYFPFKLIDNTGIYYKNYVEIINSEKEINFLKFNSESKDIEKSLLTLSYFRNNCIYFIEEIGGDKINESVLDFLKNLFPKAKFTTITDLLGLKKASKSNFLPLEMSFREGTFLNYNTNRLLVDVDRELILNVDNKFVSLLKKFPNMYSSPQKTLIIRGLFSSLKDKNRDEFVINQKEILNDFVHEGIINGADLSGYLLDADDNPFDIFVMNLINRFTKTFSKK